MSSREFSAEELEDARMAYLTNYNHRTMNCGRGNAEIVTVVGTSRFQDSLSMADSEPCPWRHTNMTSIYLLFLFESQTRT
jgi:hypothetical protein